MKCSNENCQLEGGIRTGLCRRHRVEKWRRDNPVRYAYTNLKDNAKRRGKEFSISFEYFVNWCASYEYIQRKGKSKSGFTVDRIDNDLGYVEGNLQCISNEENVKKYCKFRWNGNDLPSDFVVESNRLKQDLSQCPF